VQLYLKPRVAGRPFEVDNAVLWEIVGWEQTPSGGRKPVLEPSKVSGDEACLLVCILTKQL
jgi:hypothetical protein